MPDPAGLVSDALKVLQIVSDPKRSELAGLLEEADDEAAVQRIDRLRLRLASA
jgi:hypothetical protein